MRYRKLDANGDMQFGSGRINFFANQPEGVAQAVATRLRLWSGEWFLDVNEGTPYQVGALGKYTMDSIDPMLRERVLTTPGVKSILGYDTKFDENERKYVVDSVTIDTIYGQTTIQGIM